MKKILAVLLAVCMVLALAACGSSAQAPAATQAPATEAPATEAPTEAVTEPAAEKVAVMTHEEYVAAELDTEVCVETYVQATQSWWNDAITVYAQSEDGAYFLYNMTCSKDDAEKLVPGTKIRVTGTKSEWSGEVEIIDSTFEFLDGEFIAEPTDISQMLSSEDLIAHQNEKVVMKGMVVAPSFAKDSTEEAAFLYNWDGSGAAGTDSDLYFNVTDGSTNTYTFTVEYYLCNETTDAYQAVTQLKVGDIIDVEGFLYWYNGAQPHVTGVTVTLN